MCGRFTLTSSADEIAQAFQLSDVPQRSPRYNIAPTQPLETIITKSGERKLEMMKWGLIPHWAKDPKMGNKLINARAETLAEKPSFRGAFQHRRCLILANGFYEWHKSAEKKQKQPYYIHLIHHEPFAFAGLWETWQPETGEAILSCTLITTVANELMQPIHQRMPVILSSQDYDNWLNPAITEAQSLQSCLKPYPSSAMTAYRVSSLVNSPTHEQPECIEPYQDHN